MLQSRQKRGIAASEGFSFVLWPKTTVGPCVCVGPSRDKQRSLLTHSLQSDAVVTPFRFLAGEVFLCRQLQTLQTHLVYFYFLNLRLKQALTDFLNLTMSYTNEHWQTPLIETDNWQLSNPIKMSVLESLFFTHAQTWTQTQQDTAVNRILKMWWTQWRKNTHTVHKVRTC